jgi:glutathione S-transferase
MSHGFTLIIGNKNLSSWSLRPWLLMKHFDIPFKEQLIRLDVPETRAQIKEHSPSGLVPCLKNNDEVIWDSLAIAEYLAELFPEKNMWPSDPAARARARCIAAEMHSGFSNLRETWPMEFCREGARLWGGPGVRKDVSRLMALWGEALDDFGAKEEGPFLFGDFSIADAMYAPVVSRLRTYGPVPVPSKIIDYLEAVWNLPAMRKWGQGAKDEVEAGWYR